MPFERVQGVTVVIVGEGHPSSHGTSDDASCCALRPQQNESWWHPQMRDPMLPIKLLSVPQLFIVPSCARGFDVVSHIKVAVDVVVCIVFIRNQGQEVVRCLGKELRIEFPLG